MATAKKTAAKKAAAKKAVNSFPVAPATAPGSPAKYRVRVRMYRHGLGDCFLLTFPRKGKAAPLQMLIDCGALARDGAFMTGLVEHIHKTVAPNGGKGRLDVVAATHEHKDHLSGFNQAREVFNTKFDFGAVWLGWTENLTKPEIEKIKSAKRKTAETLRAALRLRGIGAALGGVEEVLQFSAADDTTGSGTVAEALEYLKLRGTEAGALRYLEPGQAPLALEGVDGVRVYVLGPPQDPILLKGSEVTGKMKRDGVIYHLGATGAVGLEALGAAAGVEENGDGERFSPFAAEHRITRQSPYFANVAPFLGRTYDDPAQAWRQIETDWMQAFGQLALDLDSDTNNTSLVLAFEFEKTGEVLLFVGDAQVGNWLSWAGVEFAVPGREKPLPAHDLLNRTVFYKVGHHGSHNATLKAGGLELMNRPGLVAFIPLDRATATAQRWDMPAGPLFGALAQKTGKRVVVSDAEEALGEEAKAAGVRATAAYVDYFLV
ncbi:MAG: hypothetical protein K7J47_10335 [Acidobacteria bacterium]|jgi:hypothetical protein|nr:hypothetical protein [Bryobacteraceae bacterium CoA2 C42]